VGKGMRVDEMEGHLAGQTPNEMRMMRRTRMGSQSPLPPSVRTYPQRKHTEPTRSPRLTGR
jgi:hypothetical protein